MAEKNYPKFGGLQPIDYINSFLITKGIRDAYLIQNFDSSTANIEQRVKKILHVFPSLHLLRYNNYYFLSVKPLQKNNVDSDKKIAQLLRFSCDVDFKDLDRKKETVAYNINVFLKADQDPITIITYLCQTKSTIRSAEQLVNDIRKVLDFKVELDVNVDIPVVSLIPKLVNPKYKFNDDEIHTLDNVIYNIMNQKSYHNILSEIDYNNLIHRGIVLTYITDHEHDTLQPFYPLNTSGHMEEIYEIEDQRSELMKQILVDSKKSMKSKWFGGNKRTRKKRQ
jgi:hypothetical protein